MITEFIEVAGRQFVTVTALAKELHLHPRTLLSWESEHGLPVVRIGNMRLYDVAELGEWLDRHKKQNLHEDRPAV